MGPVSQSAPDEEGPAACGARRHTGRAPASLRIFDRRVAQQQPLDARLLTEVDVRHRLVTLALDPHDGAEAEGVVADPGRRSRARRRA